MTITINRRTRSLENQNQALYQQVQSLADAGLLTEAELRRLFAESEDVVIADDVITLPVVAWWCFENHEQLAQVNMDHASFLLELLDHQQWAKDMRFLVMRYPQALLLIAEPERWQWIQSWAQNPVKNHSFSWVQAAADLDLDRTKSMLLELLRFNKVRAVQSLWCLRNELGFNDEFASLLRAFSEFKDQVIEICLEHGLHVQVFRHAQKIGLDAEKRQQVLGQITKVGDPVLVDDLAKVSVRELGQICGQLQDMGPAEVDLCARFLMRVKSGYFGTQEVLDKILGACDSRNAPWVYRWVLWAGLDHQVILRDRNPKDAAAKVKAAWFYPALVRKLEECGWVVAPCQKQWYRTRGHGEQFDLRTHAGPDQRMFDHRDGSRVEDYCYDSDFLFPMDPDRFQWIRKRHVIKSTYCWIFQFIPALPIHARSRNNVSEQEAKRLNQPELRQFWF